MLLNDDLWKEVAALGGAMILQPDQHFYSISELLGVGLTYYKINRLVDEGCHLYDECSKTLWTDNIPPRGS